MMKNSDSNNTSNVHQPTATLVGVDVSPDSSSTPYQAMPELANASPNKDPPAGASSLVHTNTTNDTNSPEPQPAISSLPPPPPPRSLDTHSNPYNTLPPGWATAADPNDGRIYYYERASGQTSWSHPLASHKNNMNSPLPPPLYASQGHSQEHYPYNNTHADYDPRLARSRPDNHQCSAVTALVLFFPLGLFAIYHSYKTDASWKAGKYGDALVHARQAKQYASWGTTLGVIFWILWFFFRRGKGEWEWPNVGEWFSGGG